MREPHLFDHLVSEREQIVGYAQPERLCGPVDEQLELGIENLLCRSTIDIRCRLIL